MAIKTSYLDIISYAKGEIGYLEKKTNSQLDSKTANAGSNNYTKYTRDVDNSKICNFSFQGQAWCAGFVIASFLNQYGKEATQKALYLPTKDCKAYNCQYFAEYFQNNKAWYTSNPRPGDLIFFQTFNSNGTVKYNYAHVGIVIDVSSTTITTVEGNTNGGSTVISNGGGVCQKAYSINFKGIKGFGRPKYDIAAQEVKYTNSSTTIASISVNAKQLKQGITYTTNINPVKSLQILLNGYGYNCGTPDGDFGKNTANALLQFQKANGLSQDKIAGKQTWQLFIG